MGAARTSGGAEPSMGAELSFICPAPLADYIQNYTHQTPETNTLNLPC